MRRFVSSVLALLLFPLFFVFAHQESKRISIVSKDPPDINPQYFPTGVFSGFPELSDFDARWYAKHLRTMKEPSLLEAAKDEKIVAYRFLWLRAFDHPVSIRVAVRPNGSALLTAMETDGAGGYQGGTISHDQTFEISTDQVMELSRLLGKVDFWSLQTEERKPGARDGAQWIFEGVRGGKYHVIVRWSPGAGDYKALCLTMLSLSQIDPGRIY